jgi:hypothetical protein
MNIKKMFDECKELYGSVVWDSVELALTQDPYPDTDSFGDSCFYADAMDADGNLWWVMWYAIPDVDTCLDYCDQVEDWDKPYFAEMVDEGYYLD